MAEALAVIAIITVLFAITVPNIIMIQRDLRQKELDNKAELLYLATQNSLSKMRASGNAEKYVINEHELPGTPSDMAEDEVDEGDEGRNLHYLLKGDDQAKAILEDEKGDGLVENHWIIEYEPSGGNVYAVYYSEEVDLTTDYLADWVKYNSLRDRTARLNDGAVIGYYGGDELSVTSTTDVLKPTISVTNADVLSLHLQCKVPTNLKDVIFKVTIKDDYGHSYTEKFSSELSYFGRTYSYDLILDDLSNSKNSRFSNKYGENSDNLESEKLVSGSRLVIELTASSSSHLVSPGKALAVTNSLFADGSTKTEAQILYGRHLQNLDKSSNVISTITAAEFLSDVSLNSTDSNGWIEKYFKFFNGIYDDKPNFKPIENDNLKQINGNGFTVSGLSMYSAKGDVGLFKTIKGDTTIKALTLTGSKVITDTGSSGVLVGTVTGDNNTITGCGVYLNRSDIKGMKDTDVKIDGYSAGGIIGKINGDVSISKCFASTVIRGREYAGGLIGRVEAGTVNIDTSYADSYISGLNTAGIAAGDINSLKNCYSAGYQSAKGDAAGLVNGEIKNAENCYTICSVTSGTNYSTAKNITAIDDTYYFKPGSTADNDIAGTADIGMKSVQQMRELLGDAFQTDTSDTFAYNLRNQGLRTYSYPKLKGLRHYGDWLAEFQVGALVYYELYADGTYGFYGANVSSTLKDDSEVKGDGYGIIYKADDVIPDVDIRIDKGAYTAVDMKNTAYKSAAGSDGTQYRIYPLSAEAANTAPPEIDEDVTNDTTEFYRKIEIRITDNAGQSSSNYYYFNPLFAKSAVFMNDENDVKPGASEIICIRTARHLYNLSLYYDKYYTASTENSAYVQERDINYSDYDWETYALTEENIDKQEPIGRTSATAFRAVYSGEYNKITDVSFVSKKGSYIGLFGINTGKLSNIVLSADYDPDSDVHYYVQRKKNAERNETVYIGTLAGYNKGTVENCAVAGYYIAGHDGTLHAYSDSTLYIGGFAGGNSGKITSCSADTPEIRLSSLYASVRLAGFVGCNFSTGTVDNCYDLGYLEVTESRGGAIYAAGFAGKNEGRLNKCYCATAIMTSGNSAMSYGFAPKGGVVSSSYYLDNGSYYFIKKLYSYSSTTENTSGRSCTYKELQSYRSGSVAREEYSYNHPNTGDDISYPFRAVVKNEDGKYVHYGDWVGAADLGTLGIFYWEREQYGSNNGYHLTYIGTVEGMDDSGSTLCYAHDDGGIVTEYGYGFYVHVDGESQVKVTTEGLAMSIDQSEGTPGTYNRTVAAALKREIAQYTFYPYTTKVSDSGDYIYLDNGEERFGTITLTFTNEEGDETSYEYTITPFFANAMQRNGSSDPIIITGSDWSKTYYGELPGTLNNPYEIRSLQQFRYINWNHEEKNCDTLVYGDSTGGNYKQFPFLQYATVLSVGKQTREAVEALRPAQNWKQTHDIGSTDVNETLTPIAGMATSSPVTSVSYNNFLYAWFGGSYDGQSYKIQNVNVVSECFSVGLFGVTAGANIKSIIMFADNGTAKVERATEGKKEVKIQNATINFEEEPGAYSIGGLIGIAYEYSTNVINTKVENCAIAGYKINDKSTNQQGVGTANVGGLIGLANINLERCSSVCDILIDCTHDHGHMAWGSYVRVGGLAGSAGGPGNTIVSVNNCYTGGSVKVSERTLNEKPTLYDSKGFAIREKVVSGVQTGFSTNIFISGMIGGSYAPNISNFTGSNNNQADGKANINNCYTYLKLPDLEGTIRSISLFASQADRYCRDTKINITNCYYLSSIAEGIKHPDRSDPRTWPEYYFAQSAGLVDGGKLPTDAEWQKMLDGDEELIAKFSQRVISDDEFELMLNGNLTYLRKYLNAQGTDNKNVPQKADSISFEVLESEGATKLNNNNSSPVWSKVTTIEESGANIDGKYSFSSHSAQVGKNYPFPTVIKQKDNIYSTANRTVYVDVHYGAWPLTGYYWENGRDSMDVFLTLKEDGYAYKDFILNYDKKQEFEPVFELSNPERAEIISAVDDAENSAYIVTVKALSEGSLTITETGSGASFILNITGNIKITTSLDDQTEMVMFKDELSPITLYARSPENEENDFSTSENGEWILFPSDDADTDLFDFTEFDDQPVNVRGVTQNEPGQRSLAVTYRYNYHGSYFSETTHIDTRVIGYIGLSNGIMKAETVRSYDDKSDCYYISYVMLEGPEMMIYCSAADGDISSFTIVSFTIDGEELVNVGEFYIGDTYYAWMLPEVTYGQYDVIPMLVRYKDEETQMNDENRVKSVIIVLEDPITGAKYSILHYISLPKYVITFDPNGGEGEMYEHGTSSDKFVVPSCEFTRTGYTVQSWQDGDGNEYPVDETITLTGNITLKPVWIPNTYTVRFNSNGGSGSMDDMTFIYDESQFLTISEFEPPAPGQEFLGWNTLQDGSGEGFNDGAEVHNLTSEQDGIVTLYASWGGTHSISFMCGEDEVTTKVAAGSGFENIPVPEKTGWTLEGWYTGTTADATKILKADGYIATDASDVEGYTQSGQFRMTEDKVLYARWKREAFVPTDSLTDSNDNGTYLIVNTKEPGENRHALSATSQSTIADTIITVYGGNVTDDNGKAYESWIPVMENTYVEWTVTYLKPVGKHNDKYDYEYPYFSIKSVRQNLYLRDQINSLQLRNTITDFDSFGGYNSKHVWTYGVKYGSQLQSGFQSSYGYESASADKCLYYGSSWITNAKNKTCAMFKLQTIYSFNP